MSYIDEIEVGFTGFAKKDLPPKEAKGMSEETGKWLKLEDHIRQQLKDIIISSPNTHILNVNYGVGLEGFMDGAVNKTLGRIKTAISQEVAKGEPRITLQDISLTPNQDGQVTITLEYRVNQTGNKDLMEVQI